MTTIFTKCDKGHDLTTPDAYIYDRGGNRRCRECNYAATANQRKRRNKIVRGAFDGGME